MKNGLPSVRSMIRRLSGARSLPSGEVVVRSIATGSGQVEYTPIGHTTNEVRRQSRESLCFLQRRQSR